MNKYIFFFLIQTTLFFSQEKNKLNCASNLSISTGVKNIKVLKYEKNTLLKKINFFNKVSNTNPEALMESILSASNLEWYNYNRISKRDKSSQDFNSIKEASVNDLFFELLYKFSFEVNGFEYSIIKFYIHDRGKIFGFAESMKKIDDRWYATSEAQISKLLFFFMAIDTHYIESIFNQKMTDNQVLNVIIRESIKNGNIDINRL